MRFNPNIFFAMNKFTALALSGLLSLTLATSSAFAAEIGRVQLDGREVILSDDFSWAYGSEAAVVATDCTRVASEIVPLSICLDPEKWTFAKLGGDAEQTLSLKNQELYLLLITEKIELSIPTIKKAAITNAQNASGLTKVKTLLDSSALIDGHEFGHIEYATTVDGIAVTYANYHSSFAGKGTVQLVFFAGKSQFDSVKKEIAEAIAGVTVSK